MSNRKDILPGIGEGTGVTARSIGAVATRGVLGSNRRYPFDRAGSDIAR